MGETIYNRGASRENAIWDAFLYNGPFNADTEAERSVLFGLYANTYLHGFNYLREIETEELARLVDNYNNSMARLTNDEAQLVLQLAGKRYVEWVVNQIHDSDMVTRGKKIEALDAEYDAKVEALAADYAALETKRQEVAMAWEKAQHRITELETRTEIETVSQGFVDIQIAEQELKAARADLAVLQTVLKGLDIQLAITQAGLDITNTNLQITNAENEVDEMALRVTETEVREAGVDLSIVKSGTALSRAVAGGEKTLSDMQGVAVKVAETDFQITETEAKEAKLESDIANIEANTAKLGLIDSDLTVIRSNKRALEAENDLLIQEKKLVDSRKTNVNRERDYILDKTDVESSLAEKKLEHDQVLHNFELGINQAEREFDDRIGDIRIGAIDSKHTIVDDTKRLKVETAQDHVALPELRSEIAWAYAMEAVQAARDMAGANIVNTLTHTVR